MEGKLSQLAHAHLLQPLSVLVLIHLPAPLPLHALQLHLSRSPTRCRCSSYAWLDNKCCLAQVELREGRKRCKRIYALSSLQCFKLTKRPVWKRLRVLSV